MGGTAQVVHPAHSGMGGPELSAMAWLAGMRDLYHFLYFPIRSFAGNWLKKLHLPRCLPSVVRRSVDQLI